MMPLTLGGAIYIASHTPPPPEKDEKKNHYMRETKLGGKKTEIKNGFYVAQFLAPSVAADLANCQFFPPDPEALLLPRLQISKYGRKTSDIQIWAKYPNMGKISKYSNMGQISKYRQNIQIWAQYSNMGQIFKDGPNIQNMGQI